jgi:hypothetical protein
MNDIERDYQEDALREATAALTAVEQMISGEPGVGLTVDSLSWLRSVVLDKIEAAQIALSLPADQEPDSVLRTIRLGMNAGAMASLEAELAPRVPVLEDRTLDGLHWLLHMPCPECGEFTIEQTGPGNGDDYGLDHTAVTVHPDRDSYDSPIGTRGGYTEVDLWCPAGHHFALIIANHKGEEFIGCVTERSAATHPEPTLVRWRLRCFGFRNDYSVTLAH